MSYIFFLHVVCACARECAYLQKKLDNTSLISTSSPRSPSQFCQRNFHTPSVPSSLLTPPFLVLSDHIRTHTHSLSLSVSLSLLSLTHTHLRALWQHRNPRMHSNVGVACLCSQMCVGLALRVHKPPMCLGAFDVCEVGVA